MCARRLRAELVARIVMGCEVEKATYWRDLYEVGLSMPGDVDELHDLDRRTIYDMEQEAFRLLWKRLTIRLRRKGDDRPMYFFRSREAQPERGSIAPHFICTGNPFKGLRRRERCRILEACGFGYRHSCERVRSTGGLAHYYTLYVTDQAQETDPRFRIPEGVCRYSASPGFMPDRESWRAYSRLLWEIPESGIESVVVNGPKGFVRLDRESRWWLTAEWRAARCARWWEQDALSEIIEAEKVEDVWTYYGKFKPTSELRFRAASPRAGTTCRRP